MTTLSGIGLLVELRTLFRNNLTSSVGTVSGQRSLVWPSVRFTFLSSILVWSLFRLMRTKEKKSQPEQETKTEMVRTADKVLPKEKDVPIKILYGSVTGKAKLFANEFLNECTKRGYTSCSIQDLKDYEPEDCLTSDIKQKCVLVIFISTYTDGTPPENAAWFYKYVTEMACDFRFQKDALKGLRYAICGLGNSLYEDNFNKIANELDKSFNELQGVAVAPLYCCDENTVKSRHGSLEGDFAYWLSNFFQAFPAFLENGDIKPLANGCCQSMKPLTAGLNGGGCCQGEKDEKMNGGAACCQSTNEDNEDDYVCCKSVSKKQNGNGGASAESELNGCCQDETIDSKDDTLDCSQINVSNTSTNNGNSNQLYEDTTEDEDQDKEDKNNLSDMYDEIDENELNEEAAERNGEHQNGNGANGHEETNGGEGEEEAANGDSLNGTAIINPNLKPSNKRNRKRIKRKVKKAGLGDMEDLGHIIAKIKSQQQAALNGGKEPPKEMITPLLRKSMEKQGYKLVGSHSGVKLCRWTKSMLRGRGGCYKHTFYGIESHRCMEATPSLACANKCVFCWRHHTNPVGTEWKWKMDDAEMIVEGVLKNHYAMINEFKGVPGVKEDRLEEGFKVRHCALSLVGEPIMYPAINKLVDLLHAKEISTFLVTNAQFPDAIKALKPVTQLYVSVDAPTKESLKRIDRPLFKDFWQRYLDSLKAIGEKKQRTVYRLTLVKGWNVADVKSYVELINLGKPDFIEIKGVTYCGESQASTLTMDNVPWHHEVVEFVKELQTQLGNEYEIACEHEHSNCLLVAHTKFKIDNEWYTFINYDKFHELVQEYDRSGTPFTSMDYIAKTPLWALYGSKEAGFDPQDERHMRKKKKDISGC